MTKVVERTWPQAPLFPETPKAAASLEATFRQFDQTAARLVPSWNWAALWFPAAWYLIKGLWVKALLMLVGTGLWVFGDTAPGNRFWIPALFLAGYSALFSKYDLYMWRRFGKQFW